MKALKFDHAGALDALALAEMPRPVPADGEVLVRVCAAGLNPSDLKNVLGRFPYTTLPRVPGRDFAGIVEDGPAALKGKAVWGSGKGIGFTRDGSHADYLALPAAAVSLKPESLSFAQAASCGVPWITAWEAIERAGVTAGATVIVIGASGAVGLAMSALAKARGARVIGAVRRAAQLTELAIVAPDMEALLLGEADDFVSRVSEKCEAGADIVIDTTGFWLAPAVAVLADRGRLVSIAAPADGMTTLPVLAFYRRSATLIGVNSLLHDSATCAAMLARLGAEFDQGALPLPPPPHEWPLANGVAAYEALEAGGAGKIVLVP
ncbi:zinc-binding alcohol dehydrogenase family protein [Alcanivorax sp. JB21]|uniref:quinone oxidoreductase family protein n=1 Tax=Alcanivorax limicola TaxID=2874102 RepID=UPI001CBA7C1E|nr:zinc-binding alcohol dehydrogenase family protein [Alcanivorax limicola]MBZ2187486.1 zinc-binding alcohol dehydrogenase family protein [Alcanivorax limicola]